MAERTFDATVVITTKDRRDELPAAIESALAQSGAAVEVLVIDDGSTDGTGSMVAARYPEVRLDRTERSLGLIPQRTRAAKLARAPIIVSIDDDARLVSPHTVAQTLADFDHERVGAVAIPFLDVRAEGVVERQVPPDRHARWVTDVYVGTAHALRRDLFLALGGYRSELTQQGEEYDYCLRLLASGHIVRIGRAPRLEHHESPRRVNERVVRLAARNNVLRAFHLLPMPDALTLGAKQVVGDLLVARRFGHLRAGALGIGQGLRIAARRPDGRRPVSRQAMRVDRKLRAHGPLRLDDLLPLLPAIDLAAAGARVS